MELSFHANKQILVWGPDMRFIPPWMVSHCSVSSPHINVALFDKTIPLRFFWNRFCFIYKKNKRITFIERDSKHHKRKKVEIANYNFKRK